MVGIFTLMSLASQPPPDAPFSSAVAWWTVLTAIVWGIGIGKAWVGEDLQDIPFARYLRISTPAVVLGIGAFALVNEEARSLQLMTFVAIFGILLCGWFFARLHAAEPVDAEDSAADDDADSEDSVDPPDSGTVVDSHDPDHPADAEDAAAADDSGDANGAESGDARRAER